ncbi:MAG: outer membrane beta-barrel protein [Gammaproteobacteria bacterium]|jgi:opacity protein-like surface antigen
MMKRILFLGLFSSLFFTSAHALEDIGFYAGIDATATWWEFKVDNKIQEPFSEFSHNYTVNDWNYSALFRVGGYFLWGNDERIFTAIEIFGQPNDMYFLYETGTPIFATPATSTIQKTESTYTLGGQLKQGYIFDVMDEDLLVFATAGLIYTQFKVMSDFLSNGSEPILGVFQEDKFYRPALRLGAGAEWFITDNLGLDIQAAYDFYESKTLTLVNQVLVNNQYFITETAGTTDFDPRALTIGLGFNFYFSAIIDEDN